MIISLQKSGGPKNYICPPESIYLSPLPKLPAPWTDHLLPGFLSALSATIQYSTVHPLLEKFFQRANMIISHAPKSHLHLKTQWLPVALGKKTKIFNMLNAPPHG